MPITIEIAGRSLEIAPYMLGDIEAAADFIDKMNELMADLRQLEAENKGKAKADQRQPTAKQMTAMLRCLVEILAIGVSKADPALSADAIMAQVNFSFMASLQQAVFALLAESGLAPAGEAKAPSPPRAPQGAEALESMSAE